MITILPVHQKALFSLDAAQALLPILRRVTEPAHNAVERLLSVLSQVPLTPERRDELEAEVHQIFHVWQEKVQRLGGVVKGMWLVDFDNGDGYYCWKYPEPNVMYWHAYDQGFAQRTPLQ